jgi:hypothetical protein
VAGHLPVVLIFSEVAAVFMLRVLGDDPALPRCDQIGDGLLLGHRTEARRSLAAGRDPEVRDVAVVLRLHEADDAFKLSSVKMSVRILAQEPYIIQDIGQPLLWPGVAGVGGFAVGVAGIRGCGGAGDDVQLCAQWGSVGGGAGWGGAVGGLA